MTPKLADLSDIPVILRITDAGRRAQREQGFLQWQDGYPDKAIVESDILLGAGRLLLDGDTPVAYASLIVSDPGYEALGDIWRYSGPYGVIHRMAVSDAYRGKGVSGIFFDFLEADAADKGIKAIRVDTGRENMVMQHILSRDITALTACTPFRGALASPTKSYSLLGLTVTMPIGLIRPISLIAPL